MQGLLSGGILETVASAKYLGITVLDDLTWHNQVCGAAKKPTPRSKETYTIAHVSPEPIAYTSIARPTLECSAFVLDPNHKKDLNILEMVNRRVESVVYNKTCCEKDASPSQLLSNLGWKPLVDHRKDQRLTVL